MKSGEKTADGKTLSPSFSVRGKENRSAGLKEGGKPKGIVSFVTPRGRGEIIGKVGKTISSTD